MSLDKLINYVIEVARKEERRDKAMPLSDFKFERQAKQLIAPVKSCGIHHREREKFYTEQLEKAEKKLREEGVSVEIVDPKTGVSFGQMGSLVSGSISVSQFENYTNTINLPKFQPKINQDLLQSVEKAKTKMLEHRSKAERYEKLARAFACCPTDAKVELTVEDVSFFRLES